MRTLEDLIADKLCDIINYVLAKVIKPDIEIDKVTQLDEAMLIKLKSEFGIEGIILDVDDTLRKNMNKIPKCNQEWVESLRGKLKVIILSNGMDKEVQSYFSDRGIDYIGFAHKPLKKNFIKACKQMELEPNKVLVVGDGLYSDIYGGKRNNMKTVLVKDVDNFDR